jgi:Family of unknown function (DUF6247)
MGMRTVAGILSIISGRGRGRLQWARSGHPHGRYTAGMSVQAGPAGHVEPPGRTPAAVRAELPEALRAQLDAEYRQALEEAKASYQIDR